MGIIKRLPSMWRPSLVLAFLFFVSTAPAAPSTPKCRLGSGAGAQALVDFQVLLNKISTNPSCSADTNAIPGFTKIQDIKSEFCSPPDPDRNFCKEVTDKTASVTGDSGAFDALSGECPDGRSLTDQQMIDDRKQIFEYTGKSFYSFISNPEILDRCCGSNEHCKQEVSNTHLIVKMGMGMNDHSASAIIDEPPPFKVKISVGMIANCRTPDCIDGILFHEVGHVCHRAQSEYQEKKCGNSKTCSEQPASQTYADFTKALGPQGEKCVQDGLEGLIKNKLDYANQYYHTNPPQSQSGKVEMQETISIYQNMNYDSWAEEAYADFLFMDKWGVAGLAYDCDATSFEFIHAPPNTYLNCLLAYAPNINQAYCAQKKSPDTNNRALVKSANPAVLPVVNSPVTNPYVPQVQNVQIK